MSEVPEDGHPASARRPLVGLPAWFEAWFEGSSLLARQPAGRHRTQSRRCGDRGDRGRSREIAGDRGRSSQRGYPLPPYPSEAWPGRPYPLPPYPKQRDSTLPYPPRDPNPASALQAATCLTDTDAWRILAHVTRAGVTSSTARARGRCACMLRALATQLCPKRTTSPSQGHGRALRGCDCQARGEARADSGGAADGRAQG